MKFSIALLALCAAQTNAFSVQGPSMRPFSALKAVPKKVEKFTDKPTWQNKDPPTVRKETESTVAAPVAPPKMLQNALSPPKPPTMLQGAMAAPAAAATTVNVAPAVAAAPTINVEAQRVAEANQKASEEAARAKIASDAESERIAKALEVASRATSAAEAETKRVADAEASQRALEDAERANTAAAAESQRVAQAEANQRALEDAERANTAAAESQRVAQAEANQRALEDAERANTAAAESQRVAQAEANQRALEDAERANAAAESQRVAQADAERANVAAESQRVAQAEANQRALEDAERARIAAVVPPVAVPMAPVHQQPQAAFVPPAAQAVAARVVHPPPGTATMEKNFGNANDGPQATRNNIGTPSKMENNFSLRNTAESGQFQQPRDNSYSRARANVAPNSMDKTYNRADFSKSSAPSAMKNDYSRARNGAPNAMESTNNEFQQPRANAFSNPVESAGQFQQPMANQQPRANAFSNPVESAGQFQHQQPRADTFSNNAADSAQSQPRANNFRNSAGTPNKFAANALQNTRPKNMWQTPTFAPVTVDGGSLRTCAFSSPTIKRIKVSLRTNGHPLNANVDLWQGHEDSPQKMSIYLEDGSDRPFSAVIATPTDDNAVAIRNTGETDFPFDACVEADAVNTLDNAETAIMHLSESFPERIQGGAIKTYAFEPSVASVQLLLETDGRPLNARIELLQGTSNNKQVIELYTEDGCDRPFYSVIETPGVGNAIRIINTAPVAGLLMTARVEPYMFDESGAIGVWDSDVAQGPNETQFDDFGDSNRR